MEIETILIETENQEFSDFLHQQIIDFNIQRSPFHRAAHEPGGVVPLLIILKEQAGKMAGGLAARSYWSWLEIEYLYVPDILRGKGFGSKLLEGAEEIARRRGCVSSYLTTFEFQARDFYERHGYRVVGKLEDYPPGSAFYWMRKDF